MKIFYVTLLFLSVSFFANAQFRSDEWNDIIPFSVDNYKVDSLKNHDLINTIRFPDYNVDSIWWEKNAQLIIEEKDSWIGIARVGGLSTDSTINFFELATRVMVAEGFLWILKLYSSTVTGFRLSFNKYQLGEDDYFTAYTNFWKETVYSKYGYDVYHTKAEYRLRKPLEKRGRWYYMGYEGNEMFLEYFSPDSIQKKDLISQSIIYYLCHYGNKSKVPQSVKERYPYFDFETNNFKAGYSYIDFMFDKKNESVGIDVFRKNRTKIPEDVSQLIIVYSDTIGSSDALMVTLEKQGKGWKQIHCNIATGIGKNGFAKPGDKLEGDGKSPSGIFRLGQLFTYNKEVDTKLPFIKSTSEDKWIDDPESPDYNKYIRGETSAKSYEKLLLKSDYYKYCMVIEYNTSPVVKGKGSAIFFHLNMKDKEPTAGCVAVSEKDMLKVLKWLDPEKNPMILMGNKQFLWNKKTE